MQIHTLLYVTLLRALRFLSQLGLFHICSFADFFQVSHLGVGFVLLFQDSELNNISLSSHLPAWQFASPVSVNQHNSYINLISVTFC